MGELHVSDLLAVDREVARGAAALARWRAALARDPVVAGDEAPLEAARRVAGKSTWDALGALAPSALDAPLRAALREWVAWLLQARVGQGEEVAWARAAADARAVLAGDPPRLVSFRGAWRGLVHARTTSEARRWLEAAAEAGPAVAGAARARADKRVEVARRLGLAHPWEVLVPATRATVRAAAERLLAATDDLAREVLRALPRDDAGPAAAIHASLGREAGEGWPARLTARWLEETFAEALRGLRPSLPALPPALGAASFARALVLFGASLRVAAAPRATPFALAHEPGARAAHRLGHLLGTLAADESWQTRALGVGRAAARAQARVLARVGLLDLRLDAARILLGDDADFAPRDRFEELGARLYGAPLDARLRGAWPAARDDEPARFVARLEAWPLSVDLRERFDADWFRNPRAWSHLRGTATLGAREPVTPEALDAAVDALARALEERAA